MRSAIFSAAILFTVQLQAFAADPQSGLKGVKVLPKLDAVVKVGTKIIDDPLHPVLELPWEVQEVNGQWLWVGDSRKGWIQRSQVVTLDEAPAYYTGLINSGQRKAWAFNLRGCTWREKGNLDSAIADFGEALRLQPSAEVYDNRAGVWQDKKDYAKAIGDYTQALRSDPASAQAYNNAAWLRATCQDGGYRNGKKAVELATKACQLSGWKNPSGLDTLATAYAEAGDFDAAIKYETTAIELKPSDAEVVKAANERLALFKDHRPFREE
jgi:tetratricopeptide (TPR) repeat protein